LPVSLLRTITSPKCQSAAEYNQFVLVVDLNELIGNYTGG